MEAVQKLQILIALFEEEKEQFFKIYKDTIRYPRELGISASLKELEDHSQIVTDTLQEISLQIPKLLSL